jgi:hypothetical protein
MPGARKPTETMLAKMKAEARQAAIVVVLPRTADAEMYAKACAHQHQLTRKRTQIWAWFDEPTGAAYAAWKVLTRLRSEAIDPLDMAISDQKGEIARYQLEREAEAKAFADAQAAADALQYADLIDEETDAAHTMLSALTAPQAVEKQPGIVSVDEWHWRVIDQTLVPARYLTVDDKKITRYVNAMKGDSEIPGIEVFKTRAIRTLTR